MKLGIPPAAKAWLGEQTTIQGLMAGAGGLAWGYLAGDWKVGGTLIAVGAVGLVLRETPGQVIGQAAAILAQIRQVKTEADGVVTTAATIVAEPVKPQPPAGS